MDFMMWSSRLSLPGEICEVLLPEIDCVKDSLLKGACFQATPRALRYSHIHVFENALPKSSRYVLGLIIYPCLNELGHSGTSSSLTRPLNGSRKPEQPVQNVLHISLQEGFRGHVWRTSIFQHYPRID